jgi:hypothetical protein
MEGNAKQKKQTDSDKWKRNADAKCNVNATVLGRSSNASGNSNGKMVGANIEDSIHSPQLWERP